MARKPTEQQQQVLDAMRRGDTFDQAYFRVGLSQWNNNRLLFLERLINNGWVTLTVSIQELEHVA